MEFLAVLEGGPVSGTGSGARKVELDDPATIVQVPTGAGHSVRYRITGDYRYVDGQVRRVYRYEPAA